MDVVKKCSYQFSRKRDDESTVVIFGSSSEPADVVGMTRL
jgi:hypothetical protein